MLESIARQRLEEALANDQEPILDADVLDDLLRTARVMDRYGALPDPYSSWKPATAYVAGDRVVRANRGEHELQLGGTAYIVFQAQDPGTSGANEPAWPSAYPGNVVDNDITWAATTEITYWVGHYNINHAAAKGWLLKAAKLAPNYGLTIAGTQLQRDQAYKHAIEMYRFYMKKASIGSVRLLRRRRLPSDSPFGPLPVEQKFANDRPYLNITDDWY